MTSEEKEEALGMAKYYWQDRGRLDGYQDEKAVFKAFPGLKKAWKKYKTAKKRIDMELREAQHELDQEIYG